MSGLTKLKNLYYDPKTGYSGINDLVRKSKLPTKVVKEFLHQQDIYTRHTSLRKKFPTRRVFVSGIDSQFQADIVEMIPFAKSNDGFKYLLTCIDVFSKYAFAIPMKNKTAEETVRVLEKIFKERKPQKLQTDKGKEFYNSKVQQLFNKYNIHHFSTNSNFKASVVERFNRTLKEKMWRYFSQVGNNRYIDIIDDLVFNYNNSYHNSIKMKPIVASEKQNENIVRNNLYGDAKIEMKKSKFKVGDKVRISKWKSVFSKGYMQNYTTELFTISKVLNTSPITYKIKDWNDEEIEGIFYEPELVKYDKQDEQYEVEKILKTRTMNGNKELLILWRGFPKSMASWIPAKYLH